MNVGNSVKRGSSTVNFVILLVAIAGMAIGAYFYAARPQPFQYVSKGNIVRFENLSLARDCAALDFEFPVTDDLTGKIVGSFWGTGGLIELDASYELHINGTKPGMQDTLPMTEMELVKIVKTAMDGKIIEGIKQKKADGVESYKDVEPLCDAEILEISLPPMLPGDDFKKPASIQDAPAKAEPPAKPETPEGAENKKNIYDEDESTDEPGGSGLPPTKKPSGDEGDSSQKSDDKKGDEDPPESGSGNEESGGDGDESDDDV